MDKRTQDFLTEFLDMYNRVAKVASWRLLSPQKREDDMTECPGCTFNHKLGIPFFGMREAYWQGVFLVTEHVFVKHRVKNPKLGSCWSIKGLLERIEFEDEPSRQDATVAGEP